MARAKVFNKICDLVGPTLTPVKPNDGWPGIAEVSIPGDPPVRVALHVSLVGSHSRKAYEMRFQNPASSKAVAAPTGTLPILVGLWQDGGKSILVATQGATRVGRHARFSILFRDSVIKEAEMRGWAIYTASNGEQIFAFSPALLPAFVQLLASGVALTSAGTTSSEIATSAVAAGLLDDDTEGAKERARRAVSQVIRNKAFGQAVVSSYDGKCALCGLGAGMVEGAHIYPASAPKSPDKVWNGLALCCNHHAAFDSHRIWIDPTSFAIKVHPGLHALAKKDSAIQRFVDTTLGSLTVPTKTAARPRATMFIERYKHFGNLYDWAK